MRQLLVIITACLTLFSCSQKHEGRAPVVISLLGKAYYEPERPTKVQARLDSNLEVALSNLENRISEENFIWLGRRLGYMSRFNEAVRVFTDGLERYPESARLYRHRGHRYISLRLFDKAIDDLNRANVLSSTLPLEMEPDGEPNKINKPLSTLQFNIRYHLGVAHYLKGEFTKAWEAFVECLKICDNDDLLVACVDWMYMTERRLGWTREAASVINNVHEGMTIIENDSYYKRCRMYQGHLSPDSLLAGDPKSEDYELVMATQGYGVGNWYLYNGDSVKAKEIFEKVVAGKYFSAFGFIAAEAELARWK